MNIIKVDDLGEIKKLNSKLESMGSYLKVIKLRSLPGYYKVIDQISLEEKVSSNKKVLVSFINDYISG